MIYYIYIYVCIYIYINIYINIYIHTISRRRWFVSLVVRTVVVCLFTDVRMSVRERRMDTERKTERKRKKEIETTCRRWPASGSGELICGETEMANCHFI